MEFDQFLCKNRGNISWYNYQITNELEHLVIFILTFQLGHTLTSILPIVQKIGAATISFMKPLNAGIQSSRSQQVFHTVSTNQGTSGFGGRSCNPTEQSMTYIRSYRRNKPCTILHWYLYWKFK